MAGTGLKTTFVTQLGDTAVTDKEGRGQHRYEDRKWYKWVQYNDGAGDVDAVVGTPVGYLGINGYRDSVVTGDTSVDANKVPGGMLVSAPATGEWCWILIKGYYNAASAVTTDLAADGREATLGSTDQELDDKSATALMFGIVIDESAGLMVVDCPF